MSSEVVSGGNPPQSHFACPRCSALVEERFYGPCGHCREELGIAVSVAPRSAELGRYVPKMNVVPNQVATKD